MCYARKARDIESEDASRQWSNVYAGDLSFLRLDSLHVCDNEAFAVGSKWLADLQLNNQSFKGSYLAYHLSNV